MRRSTIAMTWLAALLCAAVAVPVHGQAERAGRDPGRHRGHKPNFILIVADNLGYGDIGPFGSKLHRTPALDRMAREGMKLTHFYVTSGVCTPSRASIMTGCYPQRVGMHITDGQVLRPVSPIGLAPDEVTVAEVLKAAGYATACIGKWHLGDQPGFLPTRQGFDYYFGIPYSDDMTAGKVPNTNWPPLPLMENERVIEAPVDRNELTRRYTEKTIEFMKAHRDEPFFIYLPQAMPGSTTTPYASAAFRGKSANGPWGDSVEELDWSAGQVMEAVKQLGLQQHTLIIWTSDNGAPRRNPPQGRNEPMGGWGYTTAEGGQRVPCIAWWPRRIAPGSVCDQLTTTMDLLPTFAELAGMAAPGDRMIDGKDIWPLLSGASNHSPHVAFYYYMMQQLQAVRSGKWKLYLAVKPVNRRTGEAEGKQTALRLYDVEADPGETRDVTEQHPQIVAQLQHLAEAAREDLGDVGRPGEGQRPHGTVENPTPRVASP